MSPYAASYGVLSHFPAPNRSEHVHIGIVVFRHDGEVRAHFAQDLRKLRAIDPQVNLATVREWEAALPKLIGRRPQSDAIDFISHLGAWRLSGGLGQFAYFTEDDYLHRVANALQNLVAPPLGLARSRTEQSRLHLDLRTAFSGKGWLGKDISNHEIVERFPIGPMTTAEFAVMNGRLHVLESLDLRTSNFSAKRNDARSKALTLDMARRAGERTARYAVLAGVDSPLLLDAKALMADYCDTVFQWENPEHMTELMRILGKATGKPMLAPPL